MQSESRRSIQQMLASRSEDGKRLARMIDEHVRPAAGRIMPAMQALFPEFTPHQLDHLDGVVANLNWIIPKEVVDSLNEKELFFLLAASYLHDIGMVENIPSPPSGTQFESFSKDYRKSHPSAGDRDIVAAFIRQWHHRRSEEFIAANGNLLGLGDDRATWPIVGRIAAGHRVEDLGDDQRYGPTYLGPNVPIHRNLLSAYLRLADELDITSQRTPMLAFESVQPRGDALAHWATHLSVTGVGIATDSILVDARCEDYDVHLMLLGLENKIQGTLDELLETIPQPFQKRDDQIIPRPIPYSRVQFQIEEVGYKAWQLKFQLDVRSVVGILGSSLFYRDRSAAIRELLQNAVDACRLRARLEAQSSSYQPLIQISNQESGTRHTLTVEDNGIGMNEHTIKRHLAQVGRSFYTSEEFTSLDSGIAPLSRFGIGLLSTFMISDQITIRTKRSQYDGIQIAIDDPNGYFKVLNCLDANEGTVVELSLLEDYTDDIATEVALYARALEIPITIRDKEDEYSVPPNPDLLFQWQDWITPFLNMPTGNDTPYPLYTSETVETDYLGIEMQTSANEYHIRLVVVIPKIAEDMIYQWYRISRVQILDILNQGILIENSASYPFEYYHDDDAIVGSWNYFGFAVLGILNFVSHPEGMLFTRDRIISSEWREEWCASVRSVVISTIGDISQTIAALDAVPLIVRRNYLYHLLIQAVHGGFRPHGDRDDPSYAPLHEYKKRFSTDDGLSTRIAEFYGRDYPIAWKRGEESHFAPLASVVENGFTGDIYCSLADALYPNFRGWYALEEDNRRTAILDDPREFGLIMKFLEARAFAGKVVFMTGWDLLCALGARTTCTLLKPVLPWRSAVVDEANLEKSVLLSATDQVLARQVLRLARDSGNGNDDDYLYVFNLGHPVIRWICENTDAVTDWGVIKRFLEKVLELAKLQLDLPKRRREGFAALSIEQFLLEFREFSQYLGEEQVRSLLDELEGESLIRMGDWSRDWRVVDSRMDGLEDSFDQGMSFIEFFETWYEMRGFRQIKWWSTAVPG